MENILLVGASSSIGKAISNVFCKSSVRILATYAKTPPDKKNNNEELYQVDLTKDASISNFIDIIEKEVKKIDIAIFLSAILPGKKLSQYSYNEIDEVFSININGQIKLLKELYPFLNTRSRIIMFSSISAQKGSYDPVYAASKGALLSLVKSLIFEIPAGARINIIAPGLIKDSTMAKGMTPKRQEYHQSQIPSGELLNISDLANIVYDLCQEHWRHLNGACVDLNGGQYVR